MPCKFLLVLVARLERVCRRSTFSGQNLSSSRNTSVTKKAIKNSTGTIITSCSYTRISEGADHMFTRNIRDVWNFRFQLLLHSCLMLMMPVFYLADMIYSPQNLSPDLHSECAELEVVAILCRDRICKRYVSLEKVGEFFFFISYLLNCSPFPNAENIETICCGFYN